MSARPTRRAATRRRVVESSDEETPAAGAAAQDTDFSDAPSETPRRKTRRLNATPKAEPDATPKPTRTKRARASEPPSVKKTPPTRAPRGRKRAAPPVEETPEPEVVEEAPEPMEDVPEPMEEEEVEEEEDREATPRADPGMQLVMEEQDRLMTPAPEEPPTPVAATPVPATPASSVAGSVTGSVAATPATPRQKLRIGEATPLKISPGSQGSVNGDPPQTQTQTQRAHSPIVIKNRANAIAQSQEPVVHGPRLVITHLMLVNFKSYAGRQEVGPFHPSFSSVVGPNGSGKSNVIDSLLFVFGFRASKMRQGKISALIHNSSVFPNLDHCEVEVHFQEIIDLPDGGHEVVPDSKLVVSRKAFKNNSSKYFINGRTSDYKEVTTLLRDRGIDLDHKRFLILQGEVESIAQMKPKAQNDSDDGLLEYLEDIIGTSKYKQPIEESATQVDELNDVCQEKQSRVQIVEKEKDNLEDKKNVALEYIENENELAIKKSTLYQIHIADSEANIQITSDILTKLQAELDGELEHHRGNEDEIKKLEKKYQKGAREIEAIEQQTQAVHRDVARFEKDSVKYQEKEKFLVQKEKKLQKAIQTNRLAASEATALIERHGGDSERFGEEASALEERLETEEAELKEIIASVQDKTRPFSDQINVKQKSLEPWKDKINQKKSAIAVAQSELDLLHENANASATALAEVEAKIATIEESRVVKHAELKECRKERVKLEKDLQKVRAELEKLNQKEPQIRSELTARRQKADEARSSFAASKTQGNVLNGLMRLKDSGRIEGFHGRLGNLGAIDAKYDVAISTACPALENMVVDTVEAGQQCIDYLRKNNLGRAKFICLDKLPQSNHRPIDTPENAPRLFDLVKPKNPIFQAAFYSVLNDTLVANNLEEANRLAYGAKRWRVVTLDGQLIDKSGTMSGGGTTVNKGRMSSKLASEISPEALRNVEAERDEQEQVFANFEDRQRELQTAVRDLSERIPELDVTMSKIELEISSSERHMVDAERRMGELKQAQVSGKNSNKSGIAVLEKQIKALESEMEALIEETSGIEEEISALNDKISQVGGARLRGQKSKVDGIREQLETLTEQISTADMNKTKAEKQLAKSEKALASSERELETIGNELEELKETIREHKAAAAETKEKAEEDQAYLETSKDQLATFKENLEEKISELNATRAAEIEMRNKLEEHTKTLADNQKRSRHWLAELEKLALQDVAELTGTAPTDEEAEPPSFPMFTEDELQDISKPKLIAEIATFEEKVQNVSVDLSVLAEYRRRVEEYTARSADLNEAVTNRDAVKERLDDLRKRRLEEFMTGFNTISLRLKEMYQMITMGGNAELELVDSLDPFSEGILFSVMPPKKSWKNISNLSGGEKTLSSLALVFALHHYKPTPLYVMDEIDAALDFRNVSIVASYIKERTKNAQFVVISLRNNMFELAARLVGVYKVNHMTKSVTIENRDYVTDETVKAPPPQGQQTQQT